MAEPEKDTIPRLQQLVPHMRDQLSAMRSPTTFEQSRLRYQATVDRLVSEGRGRRAASRVGDDEAFWAPTAEVLGEAMRLGLVERQPLPSARRYVAGYRNQHFSLTPAGVEMADLSADDPAAFYDRLTQAIYDEHPYVRALIGLLNAGPLVCPEVSEGDVEEARKQRLGLDHWATWAVKYANVEAAFLTECRPLIAEAVRRRFSGEAPPSKALAETLSDAFAAVALRARGAPFGALDLSILRQWGTQLRVIDQSRYVPEYRGANTIWLAAELVDGDRPKLLRAGFNRNKDRIADAVLVAYSKFAAATESNLAAPYAPIFRVRAAAAFDARVPRAVVDRVIEALSDGLFRDRKVRVLLHLGTTKQPPSEPPYKRGGSPRYEMTVQKA